MHLYHGFKNGLDWPVQSRRTKHQFGLIITPNTDQIQVKPKTKTKTGFLILLVFKTMIYTHIEFKS